MPQGKKARYKIIAEELLAYIHREELTELPSVQELAKRFSVGVYTMGNAIQELARKGIVSPKQGRKTYVLITSGGSGDTAADQPDSQLGESARKLDQLLHSEIMNGKRKTGQPLPKVDYLVAKLKISRRTVAQVFRSLEQEGLIHKEGKKWVVGPSGKIGSIFEEKRTVLSKHAPVVLVLCPSFDVWRKICMSDRQGGYAHALCDELQKYHIRMIVCGIQAEESNPLSPSGLDDIRDLVRSCGDRYLGTIIPGGIFPYNFWPSVAEWLAFFGTTGKPLVWCDLNNKEENVASLPIPSNVKFVPIQTNCEAEVSTVLTTFSDLGHKRIGVPYKEGLLQNWSRSRMEMFRSIAKSQFPHLELFTPEISGIFWHEESWNAIPDWTEPHKLTATVKRRIHETRYQQTVGDDEEIRISTSDVAASAPFLTGLLKRDNVTAIVSPNDFYACQIYAWLSLLGLELPRDLSLVSFDNALFVRGFPIATMDRGFSHMSYCAVHLILNSIPIKLTPIGQVLSVGSLVDRGSLAEPRTKRLLF